MRPADGLDQVPVILVRVDRPSRIWSWTPRLGFELADFEFVYGWRGAHPEPGHPRHPPSNRRQGRLPAGPWHSGARRERGRHLGQVLIAPDHLGANSEGREGEQREHGGRGEQAQDSTPSCGVRTSHLSPSCGRPEEGAEKPGDRRLVGGESGHAVPACGAVREMAVEGRSLVAAQLEVERGPPPARGTRRARRHGIIRPFLLRAVPRMRAREIRVRVAAWLRPIVAAISSPLNPSADSSNAVRASVGERREGGVDRRRAFAREQDRIRATRHRLPVRFDP